MYPAINTLRHSATMRISLDDTSSVATLYLRISEYLMMMVVVVVVVGVVVVGGGEEVYTIVRSL
jgi:hypothetical protein